jgi:hypothetical protein
VRVGAVLSDLILYSRIESAAQAAGADVVRVEAPDDLTDDIDLALVDWAARRDGWAESLRERPFRVILFGPHTDLDAHASARAGGLGPMWARSKLVSALSGVMAGDA